ncbi:MAG: CBS domain-containing protein [Planctomycetota bacterium]|nr:MAG: CBS domain-containing protein [Planctomycetota bacterium]
MFGPMSIRTNLQRETAAEHADSPVVLVPRTCTLREVIRRLTEVEYGAVLVCEEERLVGIFTERDLLRALAARVDLDRPVHEFMSQPAVAVASDCKLAEVVSLMARGGYRHLPVVDPEGKPEGVVDVVGLVHWLVEHFPESVYTLPPDPNQKMDSREGP